MTNKIHFVKIWQHGKLNGHFDLSIEEGQCWIEILYCKKNYVIRVFRNVLHTKFNLTIYQQPL